MKAKSILLLIVLALLGLGQQAKAQQTIVEGLIKLSDSENSYWYYIENGHSKGGYINDADGRFTTFLTAENDNDKVRTQLLRANDKRDAQTWKVEKVAGEDFYTLVNKKGQYFVGGTDKNSYATATPIGDAYKFEITLARATKATSGNYVKIKYKGSGNYLGAFGGGGNEFLIQATTAPGTDVSAVGLHESPRSWRFVPEEDIDNLFPYIYTQGTATSNVTKWYFIKSLDSSISDEKKYLTNNAGTFSSELKSTPDVNKQLFGFIADSYSDYTDFTKIISKSSSGSIAVGGISKWALRYYYSVQSGVITMQNLIRTARNGSNALSNAGTTITAGASVASNVYSNNITWAFVPAYHVTLSNESGSNLTVNSGLDNTYIEKNSTYTVTYTVSEGYVPLVKVNNVPHAEGVLADGIYTLTLTVAQDANIELSAEMPSAEVSVSTDDNITVTTPVLIGNKFSASETATITFTVTTGYTPSVSVDGASNDGLSLNDGIYSLALSEIENGAVVSITAESIKYNANASKNDGIAWNNTPATQANYFDAYTFSFSLATGYHSPYVIVNKGLVTPSLDGSIYTVSISNVREDLDIEVLAFAPNIIPVSKDTYVNGQIKDSNFESSDELWAQADNGLYLRVSYLDFDLSPIALASYNVAHLKLIYKGRQDGKNADAILQARTLPSDFPNLETVTYNTSGELSSGGNTRLGDQIGEAITFSKESAPGAALVFDISDYLFGELEGDALRLQVAGHTSTDAGFFKFYSREGAIASNMDYMPVVELDYDSNITTSNLSTVVKSSEIKEIQYFNLQGSRINKPADESAKLYIEKTIYKSGATKAVVKATDRIK